LKITREMIRVSAVEVTNLKRFLSAALRELPRPGLARMASLCFSLAVLTTPFAFYVPLKLFAAAFYLFAVHWLINRPTFHFPPIKLPLAAFLWCNLVSIGWTASQPVNRKIWYMLLVIGIIPLAENLIASERHLEALCKVLFFESVAGGLLGTAQFIEQYRAVLQHHPGQVYDYMTMERIRGFTIHWAHFGCQQMLIFLMLLAFLFLSGRKGGLWWAMMAVIGVSILLNFTRSVWLGCLLGGVYLVSRFRPRLLWLLPALLAAGYLLAPALVRERVKSVLQPEADTSATHRYEMWGVAMRMISEHPWVGVGPENVERVYPLYLPPGQTPLNSSHAHLHSNYLQLAAERGLPVLAAWVWFMAALIREFLRIRSHLSRTRWVADGGVAIGVAIMVQGAFDYNFGIFSVVLLFLFLASLPFVAQEIETRPVALPS